MPSATKGKLFIKSFPLESFQKFFIAFFRRGILLLRRDFLFCEILTPRRKKEIEKMLESL